MRNYELTVLLRSELSEKELDKEIKLLSNLLEKNDAKIKSKKDPIKKMLAYEIAKSREAFYVYFELSISPDKVSLVDQKLKLSENILRYFLCLQNR